MAKRSGLPSSEEILEFVRSADGKVGKREIARAFGIKGSLRAELKQLLRRMTNDGLLDRRRRRVSDPDGLPPVTVLRIVDVDDDGELFALPASASSPDTDSTGSGRPAPRVLIAGSQNAKGRKRGPALGPGDLVLARIRKTEADVYQYEGRVLKKLADPSGRIVGVYQSGRGGPARVMSASRKDRTPFDVTDAAGVNARPGDLVSAEIVRQGGRGASGVRLLENLGPAGNARNIPWIAIHQHDIPHEFPDDVVRQTQKLEPVTSVARRRDLRDIAFVTIDPADARDHDDAIWAEPDTTGKNPGGFTVMVAIADVAAYVRSGTAIDREARRRGNSVYFPDRVVPMLPERLSTDLCSLREAEDRPALVCRMVFDAAGQKKSHEFARALVRSAASLTYSQAQAAIDGAPDDTARPLLEPVLKPLWRAYAALRKARAKRGPLELDLPERRLVLNDAGEVVRVVTPPRLDAHRLIEEFMIQANVCAAETLEAHKSRFIYRVHEPPSPEKVNALAEFLATVNISGPKGSVLKPQHFNGILSRARGSAHEEMVSQAVLRTQAQAVYQVEDSGHFGLNLRRYAHFTSPIRRYADLVVHRALVTALKLGADGLTDADIADMSATAELISISERRAMLAERETTDRLIAHFLADQVGADFSARISGVTGVGLFVRLDDTGADGFIPASTLGTEYFVHDETAQALVGERSGTTYRLGAAVEVRLKEVTPIAGGLRFEMLSPGLKGKPVRRGKPRQNRKRRK